MRKASFVILVVFILLFTALLPAQEPTTTASSAPATAAPPQVPRLIRFSGTVASETTPRGGTTVGVTFALYKDQTGGSPLWQEVQNVALEATGHYSVLLGASSKDGMPTELFTSNEARWLGVQVDQEPEGARVLLVSVPYALKAGDAETVGGLPASAFVLAGATPVFAGTVPTVAASAATGATSLSATQVAPLVASGTVNYLGKFINTTDLGNSSIYDSGTAVSIGGTDNLGAITFIGNVPFGDAPGIAMYNKGAGAGASVSLDFYNTPFNGGIPQAKVKAIDDGNYSDNLTFWTKPPGNSGLNAVAERVRITSTGNVGIGTSAPGQKLTVAGTVQSTTGGFMFPDSTTQTTALPNGCTTSQIPKWSGTAWTCQADQTTVGTGGGTVTSITAGNGLTGGTITTTGTLAVDATKVPVLASANTFTANQSINGSLTLAGPAVPTSNGNLTPAGIVHATVGSGVPVLPDVGSAGAGGVAVIGVSNAPGSAGVVGIDADTSGSDGWGVLGVVTSEDGNGVEGRALATIGAGYGVVGTSESSSGVGVWASANATSGATFGVSGTVASPGGVAGVFNNSAGGKILSGRNNGVEKFSVDGSGNLNVAGTITGTLSGTIASSNLSGTYSNAVIFNNAGNSFTGNGASLTALNATNISSGTLADARLSSNVALLNATNNFATNQAITGNLTMTGNGTVGGNLALPNTTSASVGVLSLGGTPFLHNFGSNNTFVGTSAGNMSMTGNNNSAFGNSALQANTTGLNNNAFGFSALQANTTGGNNHAFGDFALQSNTTGGNNAAIGFNALLSNTTGSRNAAFGSSALQANTTGNNNSAFGFLALAANTANNNAAFGFNALQFNTTGSGNAAFGSSALLANTTGFYNAAFGNLALQFNTTGVQNAAFGLAALNANTTGFYNAAFGLAALYSNTTGNSNDAFGDGALQFNTTGVQNAAFGDNALGMLSTGDSNTAIGANAGSSLTTGSNNIYIGNAGVASESNTIRIGDPAVQTATFLAGISGATSASGVAVFVNSNGQLGTTTSSRRFKHPIADMGTESDLLMKLRPVAFYYKPGLDQKQTRQYGLVAEEVAQVAPQLVVYDKDGSAQTVRYHFVNAMLLNEVQKQHREIERLRALETQLTALQAENYRLRREADAERAAYLDVESRLLRLEHALERVTTLSEASRQGQE